MNEMQVLELMLQQMGELRIPLRETELRERLTVIAGNIQALRDAIASAREADGKKETAEGGAERV